MRSKPASAGCEKQQMQLRYRRPQMWRSSNETLWQSKQEKWHANAGDAPTVWRVLGDSLKSSEEFSAAVLAARRSVCGTQSRSTARYSHLVCFRLDGVKQPSCSSCPGDSQHSDFCTGLQFTPICYRFQSLVCYFLRRVFWFYSLLRYIFFSFKCFCRKHSLITCCYILLPAV